jgi:CDP-glycerol glycerophosphotransferase
MARVFADDRHVPDLVLSTSPGMTPVLAQAFAVPPARCLELGYPRNDHLLDGRVGPGGLVDDRFVARLRNAKVVGYFPTFRDDSVSIPGGAPVIEQLAEIVGRQDAVLLFKSHDASEVDVVEGGSLVVLPGEADLNAYLGLCDILVTDYSSVASDFLLLGRPIVLFVPDLEAYVEARGFALDPADHLPGVVTTTAEQLYARLGGLEHLEPPARLEEQRTFYWGDHPAAAGAAIRALLEEG